MEKKIRAILLQTLGLENYLSLVSRIYIRLIKMGFMKQKYPELFYLKQLVKPGYVCVDIGANVGYYSTFLSLYTGKQGHVYAVEPVDLFARIFKKNTQTFSLPNITLHQTALGGENKMIQMGTPMIDGVFRHGLTKVVNSTEATDMHTYDVEMHIPDELFASLTRFDFLKCDVEGYEVFIMPHFMKTISKFKPLIQMEISSPENRKQIFDLFLPLGYSVCGLQNSTLQKMDITEAMKYEAGDFYFSSVS
jgi:FkbM family methyltransferase